jgi:hypothetical protein
MPNDPKIFIPIVTVMITVVATFLWQYLGNLEFRKNINFGASWVMNVLIKKYFIWSVYLPLLIFSLTISYMLGNHTVIITLTTYSVWVTLLVLYFANINRKVSTVITCKFGDSRSEKGQDGLIYIRYPDGDAKKELFKGDLVRRSDFASGSYYIYFKIRENVVKHFQGKHCIVLVEYFDCSMAGNYDLQYDSDDRKHPNPLYKNSEPCSYSGSNRWRLGMFNLQDPTFKHRQNGNADFRIRIAPLVNSSENVPDLHVRKVVCFCLNN